MKYSIKFLTAALAMTALASCSDNFGYEGAISQPVNENDLSATLISPEIEGAGTRVGVTTNGKVVWAENDVVRVYSLENVKFNSYVLDENQNDGEGAGYEKASMKPDIVQNPKSTDDYAVAYLKDMKGVKVYSTDEGTPGLEAFIPSEYEWGTVQDAGEAYKVAAPYWGKVVSTDPFACQFHALTSFLQLDLADLPANTQSIMLTTHEDFELNGLGEAHEVKGGANEPLSGGFEAELFDVNKEPNHAPAVLKDGDQENTDYIRINFEPSEVDADKTLIIPVIAQKYQKLYVIAVKEYGKSRYQISDGEILKVYDNEEFTVNKMKILSLGAEIEYNGTNPAELSNLIAAAADCQHTVRVKVKNALTEGEGKLFINNALSNNNVQITFEAQQTAALTIVEAPAEVTGQLVKHVDWGTPVDPDALTDNGDKARTVSVDFAAGAGEAATVDFYLPTSYVNISAEARVKGLVQILAAKSKDMAKPMSPARDVDVRISNNKAKDAPIVIHSAAQAITTFDKVFVMPQSKSSAIYVYNPETEITDLWIGTKNPGALRLTDALVGTIAYKNAEGNVITVSTATNIYTDGSAAIKDLVGGGNNVKLQADWTGRGLTVEAVAAGYDQEKIYTAAQLQGVGLAAGSDVQPAVYKYKIADKVTDMWLGGETYPWIGASMQKLNDDLSPIAYNLADINTDEVALAEDIVIDGNFKGLYNMELAINDPYFNDPHSCCTSCSADDVRLTENLGLIRSIITKGQVTVKNFRLNDVEIIAENNKIPNVGSLTGFVYAGKDILLDDNETSNVRISTVGGFAGGQFGYVWNTTGNIEIKKSVNKKVNSETGVDERFVKTVGSNAGGFIGKAASEKGYILANDNTVDLQEVSATNGSNAGGIIGKAASEKGYFRANDNTVDLQKVSATNGSNVGGIAGAVEYGANYNQIGGTTKVTIGTMFATELAKEATNKTRLNENSGNNVGGLVGFINNDNLEANETNTIVVRDAVTVKVDDMTAENQFAGGLIGSADMVKNDANDDTNNKACLRIATAAGSAISVDVTNMTANNGFAGGLVAKMISGDVKILNGDANQVAETITVKIGSLNTAFAGAGVIGENTDKVLIKGKDAGDKLTVEVNAWSNTWEADLFENGHAAMTSVVLKKLCGSFAHIIGHQNEDFDIWKAFVTISPAAGIADATKKALLFPLHTDAMNTVGVATDMYWGDEAGFVGFSNKTGSYLVNGQKHADQQYNYRKNY